MLDRDDRSQKLCYTKSCTLTTPWQDQHKITNLVVSTPCSSFRYIRPIVLVTGIGPHGKPLWNSLGGGLVVVLGRVVAGWWSAGPHLGTAHGQQVMAT